MARTRRLGAAAVLALALVIASCSQREPPAGAAYRVALLSSASTSDRWELAAGDGLDRIAAELGAQVERIPAQDEAWRRMVLRALGEDGVDLVFCSGGGFEPVVYSEASAYPGSRFVLLPGSGYADNIAGVEFRVAGAAYVGGVLAALLSEDEVVGVLHGRGGPWIEGAEEGFAAGFRSLRSGGEMVVADGPDGPWALAAQGVAVALYLADDAQAEIVSAAHNAGIQLVATDPDALAGDPDVVLAAIAVDIPEAMVRVARELVEGTVQRSLYEFDLGSGVVSLRLGPLLAQTPDPTLHEVLEKARAEVTAGIVELESWGM